MSLTIIKSGLLDTIQDTGRFGYGNQGVNTGGYMDRFAGQVGNMLVGNAPGEAVIEIHFPGPQLLFEQNALISICGADFDAMINDEPLPLWQPQIIRKNNILHFNKKKNGARCYIAVHGGIVADRWLESYTTDLKAGVGGFKGRKLQKGDELNFNESTLYFPSLMKEGKDILSLRWIVDSQKVYAHPHEISFMPGSEWSLLTATSQEEFLENNFIIRPSSDRMGYQLKGIALQLQQPTELVSSGVSFGTIQLLPNGQMVVLMADHQTTGGYPRIGHVISSDLPKLAQLSPSDGIQFKQTTIEKAETELIYFQREMSILQRACCDHLNGLLCNA
jgi:antagonist of KipI